MVHFVGAGPGAPDLITLRGQQLLKEAGQVIYAGSLVNPELLQNCRADCRILDSARMTLEEVIAAILRAESEGLVTVRLHTGDPSVFGAIREQMAELDNQFHHILYDACGSKMLEHQLIDFHSYVMRIRRKTLSTIERSTASNKEHRAIMEAIRAGKADLAERLASEHMKNAYENMVRNRLYDIYKNTEE
jgi:DNA-binding GntR family transcriptional regulator